MSEQLALDFGQRGSAERQRANRVLALIYARRGRERAISMHEISALTDVPAREIQSIVKWFVEERSFPIGTAVTRPFGYYWIATERERRAVRNHFIRRGLSNLQHAKAFDRDAIVGPLVGQLVLELEKAEKSNG